MDTVGFLRAFWSKAFFFFLSLFQTQQESAHCFKHQMVKRIVPVKVPTYGKFMPGSVGTRRKETWHDSVQCLEVGESGWKPSRWGASPRGRFFRWPGVFSNAWRCAGSPLANLGCKSSINRRLAAWEEQSGSWAVAGVSLKRPVEALENYSRGSFSECVCVCVCVICTHLYIKIDHNNYIIPAFH